MKIIKTAYIIIIIVLAASLLIASGCRTDKAQEEPVIADSAADVSQTTEESQTTEASQTTETSQQQTQETESTTTETTEETEEIPEEITLMVQEADTLFAEGMYSEASKQYRDAQIAIEGSDITDESQQELLDSIDDDYNTCLDIIETARMHHSNAMNLIYEKRYEEAEAQLQAALDIYPKYQEAIDALQSLEDIKGLQ